jgi:hypothetical protein
MHRQGPPHIVLGCLGGRARQEAGRGQGAVEARVHAEEGFHGATVLVQLVGAGLLEQDQVVVGQDGRVRLGAVQGAHQQAQRCLGTVLDGEPGVDAQERAAHLGFVPLEEAAAGSLAVVVDNNDAGHYFFLWAMMAGMCVTPFSTA